MIVAINGGDVDQALFFPPDPKFVSGPARATGVVAIRDALTDFIALKSTITMENPTMIEGET